LDDGVIYLIVIGEKINGAIPIVNQAIEKRDEKLIKTRAIAQTNAGAHYLDCAPSTLTSKEYDAMVWLINVIQGVSNLPICIDSPDVKLLKRIIDEGHIKQPGMINSVNEEGIKCETIFPLIAGSEWQVIGLTCDNNGIPAIVEKKIDIAKSIIDKAVKFGVALSNLHIDPCVMALSTIPSAMRDFQDCIVGIHDYAPEAKVTGAISNISFEMPGRKYINSNCLAYAILAGLDSAIMDPCNTDMMSTIYACEALCMIDKSGRKYNRAYRQGKLGVNNEINKKEVSE